MESEALRNVRTLRQVKASLDVARSQKLRTTNSLSKTREEIKYLASLSDRQLKRVLDKERARFAAFDASLKKSRQRVLRARERLATTINKNRALTELRQELQQARWEGKDAALSKADQPAAPQHLDKIELNY
jgi:hypothetical protein